VTIRGLTPDCQKNKKMRIKEKFIQLKKEGKKAFISYLCAGDPDYDTSLEVLKGLPGAGCDLIEIGVPFLDPAGDGPTIEDASKRAIGNGMNLVKTLTMLEEFRKDDLNTPVIFMTYFNPLLKYGLDKIFADMKNAGADGVLIVDLPFEEEDEVVGFIKDVDLDFIRLVTPVTPEDRVGKILKNASGFVYLVSMLGITGTKTAQTQDNIRHLEILRKKTDLPLAIGFGIKTPETAKEFSKIDTDGIIVGSTFVKEIENSCKTNKTQDQIKQNVLELVKKFSESIKND